MHNALDIQAFRNFIFGPSIIRRRRLILLKLEIKSRMSDGWAEGREIQY